MPIDGLSNQPVDPTPDLRCEACADVYEFRIQDQLDPRRLRGLQGVRVAHEPSGDTVVTVRIVDQSALYGFVSRLRDLGVTLLSMHRLAEGETGTRSGGEDDGDVAGSHSKGQLKKG